MNESFVPVGQKIIHFHLLCCGMKVLQAGKKEDIISVFHCFFLQRRDPREVSYLVTKCKNDISLSKMNTLIMCEWCIKHKLRIYLSGWQRQIFIFPFFLTMSCRAHTVLLHKTAVLSSSPPTLS